MRRMTIVTGCLAASCLAAGCGWKADGAARVEQLYGKDAGAKADATTTADPGPEEVAALDIQTGDVPPDSLAGRWAVKVVQKGTIEPLGMLMNLTLVDTLVAEFSADQKTLTLTTCDEASEAYGEGMDEPTVVTATPQALKDALAKAPVEVTLPGDGTLPATDVLFVWGANLKDPAKDALPTKADDATVVDTDGDKNPGITVDVTNMSGSRYMARRGLWHLSAAEASADGSWLTGTLTFKIEEVSLGATSSMLETVAPITPGTDGNSYVYRRVGADWDCKKVLENAASVFAGAPE